MKIKLSLEGSLCLPPCVVRHKGKTSNEVTAGFTDEFTAPSGGDRFGRCLLPSPRIWGHGGILSHNIDIFQLGKTRTKAGKPQITDQKSLDFTVY